MGGLKSMLADSELKTEYNKCSRGCIAFHTVSVQLIQYILGLHTCFCSNLVNNIHLAGE